MIPVVPISRPALASLRSIGLIGTATAPLLKAKRGEAIPGHKYLRREPKPDGTWRYFYPHPEHGPLGAPSYVQIVHAQRQFFGDGRAARRWALDNLRGTYCNDHSGMLIRIGRSAIKKVADVSAAAASATPDHFEAIHALPQLLKHAVLVESHPDRETTPDIKQVHRFVAPLRVGGKTYRVKLTVKDYKSASPGFYTHELTEIEMPASGTLRDAKGVAPKATAGTISIADLLAGAKRQDGQSLLKSIRLVVPRRLPAW